MEEKTINANKIEKEILERNSFMNNTKWLK